MPRGLRQVRRSGAPDKGLARCRTVVEPILPRHRLRRAGRASDPAVLSADRARRQWLRLREAAAEQPGEEAFAPATAAGWIVAAATAAPAAAIAPQRRAVRHGQNLTVRDVDIVLDRHVGDPLLRPIEQRDQRLVAAIEVLA